LTGDLLDDWPLIGDGKMAIEIKSAIKCAWKNGT